MPTPTISASDKYYNLKAWHSHDVVTVTIGDMLLYVDRLRALGDIPTADSLTELLSERESAAYWGRKL